jgi:hypothetical protein
MSQREIEEINENEANLQGTYGELFANKVYLRNLLIMMFIWSFGSFAFLLVPFYVATIKIGNIYLNLLFSEIAEFAASILVLYVTRVMTLQNSATMFSILIFVGSVLMSLLITFFGGA